MVKVYRLKEFEPSGKSVSETFKAPDDEIALSRVLDVSAAAVLELWRGSRLVARVDRRHLPPGNVIDMAEAALWRL